MEDVSISSLVQELLPEARATVPDDVRASVLAKVRAFLANET